MNLENMKLEEFLNRTIPCSCGREHRAALKVVEISRGALEKLPEQITGMGYHKAFLVCDRNTDAAAGRAVRACLEKKGIPYTLFRFETEDLVPDEQTLGSVMMHFDMACDLILAVGSGTINDTCRFLSHRMHLDYFIVATAPSMDGFASTVAPLITNNLKTTYEAHVPTAIFADIDILARAPMNMISAGFGDILGKYSCLCDWKFSSIVNGEYYCDRIASLMTLAMRRMLESRDGLLRRDPEAAGHLMEALVLAGIAMSFAGNSRPASGSEHHLSHYWEMQFLFAHKKPVLHGIKVGIGTVCVLRLHEYLRAEKIDFAELRRRPVPAMDEAWRERIRHAFGPAADEVIRLEERVGKNSPEARQRRLSAVEEHWDALMELDRTLPSSEEAAALLRGIQGPAHPKEVGLDAETVHDGVLYAKEVRDRYTLLQLLWDLGLLDAYADRLSKELYQG